MMPFISNGTSCARNARNRKGSVRRVLAAAIVATPAIGAIGLFTLQPSPAPAATQYWDLNSTNTGGVDGGSGDASGVWDTTTSNWTADSGGTTTTTVWAPGNIAVFSAGTNATGDTTITVSGTQNISGLTFEEGNTLTFNGGAFTLVTTTVTFAGASATTPTTINNNIGGTSALTKNGSGSVTLTGALSYSGTTTLSTGDLTLTANNVLPGAMTVSAGNMSLPGNNSIGGLLTISGGTFSAPGTNTFSGGITVNGGTQSLPGTYTLGNITVGGGSLTLSGINTPNGNTTVNAGTLNLNYTTNNSDKIKSTGTLTLGNLSQFNIIGANGAQDTTQSVASTSISASSSATITVNKGDTQNTTLNLGAITRGASSLIAFNTGGAGAGNAVITTTSSNINANGIYGGFATYGPNDFATVSGGNVVAFTGYNLDSYAANANTDATLDGGGTDVAINSLRFNANANVTVTLSGNNNTIAANGGILVTPTVSGNAVALNGGKIASAGSELVIVQNNTTSDFSFGSEFTGTAALLKGGKGAVLFTTPTTSTGTHTIMAGTIRVGAGSGVINDAAPLVVNTGGTFDLNGNDETLGALSGAGAVTGAGNLTVGGLGTNTTHSGVVSISGNLTKVGTGTFTMSATNTYAGQTNINQGVVAISSSFGLGANGSAGTIVATGAALQVTGTISTPTTETLELNGTGVNNTGALRKTANNVTTYAGAITINTTSSRINSDAGTLRITGALNGNGTDTIDATFGGVGNISYAGAIQATINRLVYDGTGTLTLSTNSSFGGGITINNGGAVAHPGFAGSAADPSGMQPPVFVPDYFLLTNGGTINDNGTGSGRTAINYNKGITVGAGGGKINEVSDGTNVHIYRGLITGSGSFTKLGAGILSITGSQNSYTGGTIITAGTLRLRQDTGPGQTGPGQISSTGTLTVTSPGTFDLSISGLGQSVGALSGNGSITAPAASTGTLTIGNDGTNTTWSGRIATSTGAATAVKITKVGAGTWTINGADFQNTGAWAINGGTVKYGAASGNINDASPLSIGASGTLDMANVGVDTVLSLAGSGAITNLGQLTTNAATNTTFSGAIGGGTASSLIKPGSGLLRLSGTSTYQGTTQVQGGTLEATSSAALGDGANTLALSGGATFKAVGVVTGPSRTLTVAASNATVDTNGNAVAFGNISGAGTLTKAGAGNLTANYARVAGLTVSTGNFKTAPNGGAGGTSVVGTMNLGANQFDLSDNHLIDHTDATGTWDNGTTLYTGLTGLVASGRAGNLWTGPGIVTSQTAAAGTNYTSIGIAKASDARPATATSTGSWAGQTITGTDTLVMYTYGGDATLDGKINVDDYIKIDSGISAGLTGWSNGDFNYDGKVNIDDYTTIIDANIGNQSGTFFSAGGIDAGGGVSALSGVSAVPEPGTISLIGLGSALMLARRKRRHR